MARSFLNITVSGQREFDRLAKRFKKEVEEAVDDELNATVLEIQAEAKANAPKDRGQIANSIGVDVRTKLKKGISVTAIHAAYMEFGTGRRVKVPAEWASYAAEFKGGQGGTYQDFIKSLTEWVRRKGVAGRYSIKSRRRLGNKQQRADEDKQVAEAMAFYILLNGLKPRPFLYPAYKKATADLPNRLSAIVQDTIDNFQ